MSADLLVHLNVILGGRERILAGQERIDENAERPPVDRVIVRLDAQNLGRHVLNRAADRARALAQRQPFRQAEIDELHVATLVEQDVLHLDVAIDDALAVQVVEHETHLDGVDGHETFGKVMHLEPEREQLAVLHIVRDYVQEAFGLPVEPGLHNERILHTTRGDGHLVLDLLQRSIPNHLTLPHDLHGVDLLLLPIVVIIVMIALLWFLLFHLDHVTERTATDHVENLEVGLGDLALHAELGHEQGLVDVDRIVGLRVPVRVGQRLGLVLATRRVPERVAHETRREERRARAVRRLVASIRLERILLVLVVLGRVLSLWPPPSIAPLLSVIVVVIVVVLELLLLLLLIRALLSDSLARTSEQIPLRLQRLQQSTLGKYRVLFVFSVFYYMYMRIKKNLLSVFRNAFHVLNLLDS